MKAIIEIHDDIFEDLKAAAKKKGEQWEKVLHKIVIKGIFREALSSVVFENLIRKGLQSVQTENMSFN